MSDASAVAVATVRFRVEGMDCAACAIKIENAVRRLPGVSDVAVSVAAGTLRVAHGTGLDHAEVERQVRRLGYGIGLLQPGADAGRGGGHEHDHPHPHPHDHPHDHDHDHHAHADEQPAAATKPATNEANEHFELGAGPWWKGRKALLTLACGLAVVLAWIAGALFPAVAPYAFMAALSVGLVPIALRAWRAAMAGTPFTIETLMTVAAVGAVIIGAAEEAAAVIVLFLTGELLEGVAAGRARASIRALSALVPKTARVERGGVLAEVPAETLQPGEILLVRPGDRIAADGEIIAGSGAVNEAPVTGESMPRRRKPGDAVFAGTINEDGVLRIRVTAAAADNTIARVVRLVEEAQETKAPSERFIDHFARYYTPGVMAAAALVAVLPPLLLGGAWGEWVYKGLAILLIGCPCALVISTPAAIAAALAAGARRGLLIKGGAVLEGAGRVSVMALDKTGTLTLGTPTVTDIVPFGRSEAEALALAAALEAGSSHPLARAIIARAGEAGIRPATAAEASAVPGKGVLGRVGGAEIFLGSADAAGERAHFGTAAAASVAALTAEGKTVSVLVAGGVVAAVLAVRDELRPDAVAGIAALRRLGIEPVMLTGDNQATAHAIGQALGIDVRAQLLPQDKLRIVREYQAAGRKVAKVGDGINDAPALAAADIGIAMGGGTDVALETADAAVLHGRVLDLARVVQLSRQAIGNIGQNIAVALGLKAVFLVTTIAGITGLWPAILADTGATVLVTANAMRLLAWRGEDG